MCRNLASLGFILTPASVVQADRRVHAPTTVTVRNKELHECTALCCGKLGNRK